MDRKEIISSDAYWLTFFEIELVNAVEKYRQDNGYNDFDEIIEALNINENTMRRLLNDKVGKIRIEELIDLSLKIGYAPKIKCVKLTDVE